MEPEKIILFGSFARGDATSESDLDLFSIKKSHESSRLLRRKIDALLRGRRFSLDLIVRKPEEVSWNLQVMNPFYLSHIFKEGKVLYEKDVQERKNFKFLKMLSVGWYWKQFSSVQHTFYVFELPL
ncbi:nucleotidyltransferase domain-containing protein [candidate division KSB1 bacterium]|nr:nucleotidyltransferase domain-containing protein [candidate division KSB1 bacterium]